MLFKCRLGFSGTPSTLLPLELGHTEYENGSDGKMIHVLTSPDVVSFEYIEDDWNPVSLLKRVSSHTHPPFHALIDPGALITGMSNLEVARALLEVSLSFSLSLSQSYFSISLFLKSLEFPLPSLPNILILSYSLSDSHFSPFHLNIWNINSKGGLPDIEGIVYLDEQDRKMVLIRSTMKTVDLSVCGIPLTR